MRRCETCWHYSPLENREDGFCHRNPPQITTNAEGMLSNMFIPVGPRQWCGEWWIDWGKIWRAFKWVPAKTG